MIRWLLFLPILLTAARAAPESEVREAIERLKEAPNYTWHVSLGGMPPTPALARRAAARRGGRNFVFEEGRTDHDGATIIRVPVSTMNSVHDLTPWFTIVKVAGASIAWTPLGWLKSEEVAKALKEKPDETIVFEDKSVRLYECLSAARRALQRATPAAELGEFLGEITRYSKSGDEISADLNPSGVARAYAGPAQFASGLAGTIVFRFEGGVLHEYEITVKGTRTVGAGQTIEVNQRQTTTISEIGTTIAVAPGEAFDRLTR